MVFVRGFESSDNCQLRGLLSVVVNKGRSSIKNLVRYHSTRVSTASPDSYDLAQARKGEDRIHVER